MLSEVKLVTDSSADLSRTTVKALGIEVVPATVFAGGGDARLEAELDPEDFYARCEDENLKGTVCIAQPTPGDFFRVYERLWDNEPGLEILSVHLPGELSGTVRAAAVAARMTQADVLVFDSGLVGPPLGQVIAEAAEWARESSSAEQVLDFVESLVTRVRVCLYAADERGLWVERRSGFTALTDAVSSFFRGNLLSMRDGRLIPLGVRCSAEEAPNEIFEFLREESRMPSFIGVMSAGGDRLGMRLKRRLQAEDLNAEIKQCAIGPVLGSYLGSGSVGVFAID